MNKLIFRIFIFSLFPLLLLIGVNYRYDPANLFDSANEYEHKVANYLLDGYNVNDISNMDERKLQKFFIDGMAQGPDVIALGTSNSMYIDSDFFPGKRLINNAVSAATFNDFLAIYDLYEKKGFKPGEVILGICPEMLNSAINQFWVSLENNYYSMCSRIGLEAGDRENISFKQATNKWAELFSLSYFQQSAERALGNVNIQPTKIKYNKGATRVTDGSYNDGNFYTDKTRENIENGVKLLLNKPAEELENFFEINPERKLVLEHFVTYLQNQDIEVVFYLMVYHPVYYGYVSKKYDVLDKIEEYLLSYAAEKRIRVVGRNNPRECNVSGIDFNDFNHLNKSGILKIFNTTAESINNDVAK